MTTNKLKNVPVKETEVFFFWIVWKTFEYWWWEVENGVGIGAGIL